MTRAQPIKTAFVVVLLAVLLAYNLDFECLLETQSCQRQAPGIQLELTSCAQPGLLPASVAILPATSSFIARALDAVEGELEFRSPPEVVLQPPQVIPLGLRAPPAA